MPGATLLCDNSVYLCGHLARTVVAICQAALSTHIPVLAVLSESTSAEKRLSRLASVHLSMVYGRLAHCSNNLDQSVA